MQSIESFKLKEPQSVGTPKPPSTYFPASREDGSQETGARRTGSPTVGVIGVGKKVPTPVPGVVNGSAIPPPPPPANSVVGKGKIAIRIGAYSGEAKPPSKLDFLGSQAPAVTPTPAPAPVLKGADVNDSAPVTSRLQNELAATLQRSNLRKKTDGVIIIKKLSYHIEI